MNINENVWVKLTPMGEKIANDRASEDFAKYGIYITPKRDGDYYKFQMWDLMNAFGGHFHMG